MHLPDKITVFVDSRRNVRYEIAAYRQLTRDEALKYLRLWLSTQKKLPKKGSCVRLMLNVGLRN